MNTMRIFFTAVLWMLTIAGCNRAEDAPGQERTEPATSAAESGTETPASSDATPEDIPVTEITPGLTMRVLQAGTGEVATAGQDASVHYTGWLHDPNAPDNRGAKFDSSVDRDMPFEFPLGAGRVIQGWDQGVVGMQIGERRELTIAPELAYGERAIGELIPPGSTLLFEVELLGLRGEAVE